jgi:hypothetical protein
MAAYTKEFLVAAYMSRFIKCSLITIEQLESLELQANTFYDKVGRDKFRTYASLDAEAIRLYKAEL